MASEHDDADDRYLWDGSGPPDPEIERLERILRPAGHDRRAQAAPASVAPAPEPGLARVPAPEPAAAPAPPAIPLRRRPARAGVAAAVLVAAAAGALLVLRPGARETAPTPVATTESARTWKVTALSGRPHVNANPTEVHADLGTGQWVETDRASRARVAVGEIGAVDVDPGSRVRLVATGGGAAGHRLALARGTLKARIWAPPGSFFVETPAGVAVDLGCAYTISVDEHGSGRLAVSSGWVAYEHGGRESFIPAAAACETRAGHGPGTPFFENAPAPLRAALSTFDFDADAGARQKALGALLAAARPRDALTLWHLLSRAPAGERGRVFDRLAAFVPPPAPVTREAIVRAADPALLDRWWNELGLGPIDHWRRWKASAPPTR